MTKSRSRVDLIRAALEEVRDNKHLFTAETYAQIVFALLARQRLLQTRAPDPEKEERDEIRLVTVMFIDVQDSTEMARRLGAEEWRQVIATAHQRLGDVIAEWDGEIGQYLGDGMLCFFGAHRSNVDDASRCVSAALEAQQTITLYAEQLAQRYKDLPFGIRIGIATGRVMVGMVGGDAKREFLAMGPATNLAARLQGLCPVGGVLIDQQTYRRIRNQFYVRHQQPVELKGFEGPVENYLVIERRRARASRFTSSHIAGIDTPFVGRTTELEFIKTLSDSARTTSKCYVVTIYGEAGVGKSRLLQEFGFNVAHPSFVQVHMMADYEKRTASYRLLRDLIAKSCNLTPDSPPEIARKRITDYIADTWSGPDVETIAAVVGYLTGYGFEDSPHIQALKRGGPGQERMAFAWLSRWFKGLAEHGTLLVIVDNLQWADAASLDWLEYLAQDLDGVGGMIIAAARPEFRADYPDYMKAVQHHSEIMLDSLDTDATTELVNAILSHVDRVPDTLIPLLIERSEGNPLFIEEIISMMFDTGVFESSGTGRWKVNRIAYESAISTLPNGLIGVVQARLDDLPAIARHVVQVASVSGQTFWASLVSEMTGMIPDTVLDDLVTRGIIVENPETSFEGERQYQYRHSLYREVAFEMLPRSKRESYHRQVAKWLGQHIAGRDDALPLLAFHHQEGQEPEPAMRAYLSAAQSRLERGLVEEALGLIDRGLALAGKVAREVALPLSSQMWALRGQAYNILNRFHESSAACLSAIRLLDELPTDDWLPARILAYRMLGLAYRSLGQYTDALGALQQAYEYVDRENTQQLASVLRAFGALFYARGRLGESLAYQQRAYNYAQELKDEAHLTAAMTQLGGIAYDRGDLATALSYFEQVLSLNRQRENSHYLLMDLRNIGAVYWSLFAYELALQAFDEADSIQQSLRFPDPLLQANRALCWIAIGRHDEGQQLLSQAAQMGSEDAHSAFQLRLYHINGLAMLGDYVRCRELAQLLVHDVRQHNPILQGRARLWLGIAEHALGEANARHTLEEALKSELEYGGLYSWYCYQALAMTCDNPDAARDYYINAANIIKAIGSSLHTRPDLQVTLMHNDYIQTILLAAQD